MKENPELLQKLMQGPNAKELLSSPEKLQEWMAQNGAGGDSKGGTAPVSAMLGAAGAGGMPQNPAGASV